MQPVVEEQHHALASSRRGGSASKGQQPWKAMASVAQCGCMASTTGDGQGAAGHAARGRRADRPRRSPCIASPWGSQGWGKPAISHPFLSQCLARRGPAPGERMPGIAPVDDYRAEDAGERAWAATTTRDTTTRPPPRSQQDRFVQRGSTPKARWCTRTGRARRDEVAV